MPTLATLLRQEAVFTAKLFFAPLLGTLMAVRKVVAERAGEDAAPLRRVGGPQVEERPESLAAE